MDHGHAGPSWQNNLVEKLRAFVEKWRYYNGTEQAGAQDFLRHLLEIYEVRYPPGRLFEQHPVRVPARGGKKPHSLSLFNDEAPAYTTERMDMYLPKVCVWEMKAPSEKDLGKHHAQLLGYWAYTRTRFMVLCNFREFWIYDTGEENGQLQPKLTFLLEELPGRGDALVFLRGETPDLETRSERITADVARMLGRIVREMVSASPRPNEQRNPIAKAVLQCVFAMFGEDTDLVPLGMFTEAMRQADKLGTMDPVWALFDDFSRSEPRDRGNIYAPYIDGPLFDGRRIGVEFAPEHIHDLYCAARDFDWKDVRPEIFGSMFEQALFSDERHELGAHFTREQDIARVVWPTIVEPWRARMDAVRGVKDVESLVEQMMTFHVLDPACGCGNFLYVAYREMKRLEAALADQWFQIHRARAKRRADIRPAPPRPYFTLAQLHGIEINEFAAVLARVVLWIGEHLANRELGMGEETLPLKNLSTNICHADALLTDWPRPTGELAIVSNPPYLGVRKLRRELGDEYVDRLFERYPRNRAADYVTYWFTRAVDNLRPGERTGYVCTNSVTQNESREASLDLIKEHGGTLTDVWTSYPWPGEAAVHVVVVNWIMAPWEGIRTLDGRTVSLITNALTEDIDPTLARHLPRNKNICFMGVTPGNDGFVLSDEQRAEILAADPSSETVIRPYLIGRDVNREIEQKPTRWIINFAMMPNEEAEAFRGAFRHVQRHVYQVKHSRSDRKTSAEKKRWWQFVRPRPELRAAVEGLQKVIVIPCAPSPHLVVSRQDGGICFDHQVMVIALSDSYHFGILQSRIHEVWARARGSTFKADLRYTNTTVFETFPFPAPPGEEYSPRARPKTLEADRVAKAAEVFDKLRIRACRERQLGLTKIHNLLEDGKELPELSAAYNALNDAVCDCYGLPQDTWRDERVTLRKLLELNQRIAESS